MNFEDVLTLIKAGYSKEEITALTAPPAEPAQAAEPAPAEPTPAAEPAPPEPAQAAGAAPDLAGVLNKINDTLAALQAAAITGDSRGDAAPKPTAGQSLAKAITMTK